MPLSTLCASLLLGPCIATGQSAFTDDFENLAAWSVIPSDGVRAAISPCDGTRGKGLRLDFEFTTGAGFCVIRRRVELDLPANYRFSFHLSAEARRNNLEFKLVDPSGENVWWVNRRDYEFRPDWDEITYKARHFRFAWGPWGGKPLEKVGFLEFAIAAGSGGKGWVQLDQLRFEPLPPPSALRPKVRTSSSRSSAKASESTELGADGRIDWVSNPADASPRVEIDLSEGGDVGGLVIEWAATAYGTHYDLSVSDSDKDWRRVFAVRGGNGGRDYLPFSTDVEGKCLRLDIREQVIGIKSLRLMPLEFGESPNALMKAVAADAPEGRYPRYFRDRQVPWTVVGAVGDDREALLDAHGAIEVDRLGFRIEPFLMLDGNFVTWADADISQRLAEDYFPVPTVAWRAQGIELEITAFADGSPDDSCLVAHYRVHNRADRPRSLSLALAVRSFQVLPPWQELNVTGGAARIESIRFEPGQGEPSSSQPAGEGIAANRIVVNEFRCVWLVSPPSAYGATTFTSGEIVEHLAEGRMPRAREVRDPQRLASAAARYDFELSPGESQTIVLAAPFHDRIPEEPTTSDTRAPPLPLSPSPTLFAAEAEARLKKCSEEWSTRLNRVRLTLPPSAKKLADSFKTAQAHILINADGPAIQPGSRTYERSWIRDGALTSAALLSTGHGEQAKTFLDWYAGYQFPDGKIPCVVDRRGPDPVPEHDSTGEFIFALLNYYRFTHDRALLERHWPRVVAAVEYLQKLRAQRMTAEYRDGPPEKRACYGLVPESISHEGYSAKPMHSYWDDFFVLKGLKDAAAIAEILGHTDEAVRFAALRDEFRGCLYDSMRLAMQIHKIDYIPGCADLGDFDATSTTIGVWPCGELGAIPEPQLTHTFERYLDYFRKRREGAIKWDGYTPYELRTVGTFVRLGRRDVALELLEFFLADQQPPAWNQWPEVVCRDPLAPRFIGDMPHTWCGSDFLNAARSLFVYERESDDSLVLAAGVAAKWLDEAGGVRIDDFPTHYGPISYALSHAEEATILELEGRFELMPNEIVFQCPDPRPIGSVELNGQPYTEFGAHEVRLTAPRGRVRVVFKP